MLDYKDFEIYITALQRANDFQCEIMELVNKFNGDLGICDYPDCSKELIKLLTDVMDDEDEWIDYWCYELNFGRDWKRGYITDKDGNDIKLHTCWDLYKFLTGKRTN